MICTSNLNRITTLLAMIDNQILQCRKTAIDINLIDHRQVTGPVRIKNDSFRICTGCRQIQSIIPV